MPRSALGVTVWLIQQNHIICIQWTSDKAQAHSSQALVYASIIFIKVTWVIIDFSQI